MGPKRSRPFPALAIATWIVIFSATLLPAPAAAQAAIPPVDFGPCEKSDGSFRPPAEAPLRELCEQELREYGAELAQEAAEAQARAVAEQAPATFLQFKAQAYHGYSYGFPGDTDLVIRATPYAWVTLTVQRSLRLDLVGEGREVAGRAAQLRLDSAGEEVLSTEWSCLHPGGTIHYAVTALGGSGPALVRSGYFKIPLTARWCAAARRREAVERRRGEAQVRQHEAERRQHEAEQRQREIAAYEHNCLAIGGIPVHITTRQGDQRLVVCHSKAGGIIPVP